MRKPLQCIIFNQMKEELHSLCSLDNHTKEDLDRISGIVAQDEVEIVNIVNEDGQTPLQLLCRNKKRYNKIQCISALLETSTSIEVDVNYVDRDGFNALHYLCKNYTHDDLIEIIRLLLGKGVHAEAKESRGWTVLHFLCKFYNHDDLIGIVQLLIDKGADVKVKDSDELTALDYVTKNFSRHDYLIDVIRLLADKAD